MIYLVQSDKIMHLDDFRFRNVEAKSVGGIDHGHKRLEEIDDLFLDSKRDFGSLSLCDTKKGQVLRIVGTMPLR